MLDGAEFPPSPTPTHPETRYNGVLNENVRRNGHAGHQTRHDQRGDGRADGKLARLLYCAAEGDAKYI